MTQIYYCKEKDCNNEIHKHTALYRSGLCKSCAQKKNLKERGHPNFKGDKALYKQTYYCKEEECNNEISINSALYGSGLCGSCAQKGDRNHLFGKKRPDVSLKNKVVHTGRIVSEKTRQRISLNHADVSNDNNPNWKEGKSFEEYPQEFNDKLKEEIRQRDNHICQKCNITEKEHLVLYERVLDVHHIDYDKENCKKDNLITLCQHCNLRANYNRDYWENLYKKKNNKKVKK